MKRITLKELRDLIHECAREIILTETDDVFGALGNAIRPDSSNTNQGDIPKLVADAYKIINGNGTHLTDPVTNRRARSDFGTAHLIVQVWESDSVDKDLKAKFFTGVPLSKIVQFLWKSSDYKR